MAEFKLTLDKQVDDSWIMEVLWNDISYGVSPVAEDFEIINFDFEASLADAAGFAGNIDGVQIINDLIYLGQKAKNSIPVYSVVITKTLISSVENFQFIITRQDGWVQRAWQPTADSSIILILETSAFSTGELLAGAGSTVDFEISPLEPDNPNQATIDIYENVDGTWQAIVTVGGTEILNDDYPIEELAHQAAQAAIAAL